MKEELYEQVRNCSFNIAHFMTHNYHDAEDIAQIVSLKFLLTENKIEKPLAWSSKVTKNEVYRLSKTRKKDIINFDKTKLEGFETDLHKSIDPTIPSEKSLTTTDAKELLSKEDYHYFKIWVRHNYKVTKLSKQLNISYYSAHCRIHRVKKNLRAAKLIKDGYIVSKEIISFNKNKNINYFIKRFALALQNDNLNDLKYYTPKDLFDATCKPDIMKVIDYDVRLEETGIHRIFIHYFTKKNQPSCFLVKLSFNKRNRISIVDYLQFPKKAIVINSPKKKVLENFPRENEKGIIPIKFKNIENVIKKGDP